MDAILQKKYEEAIWTAGSLFQRGKVSGSTGNISFTDKGKVYISASGTCFARLSERDFSIVDIESGEISGPRPSKELALHLTMYKIPGVNAIIHTHSLFSVLWSCMADSIINGDCLPLYTPYLQMRIGTVKFIPYMPPGSDELFELFAKLSDESIACILRNHGPIVGGKSILEAFYNLEELEESAKLAFLLSDKKAYRL